MKLLDKNICFKILPEVIPIKAAVLPLLKSEEQRTFKEPRQETNQEAQQQTCVKPGKRKKPSNEPSKSKKPSR